MEAKDTPKMQFLERATPPYKKSWPKRSLITLFGLAVGIFVSISIVLANQWWNVLSTDQENSEKLAKIKKMLM